MLKNKALILAQALRHTGTFALKHRFLPAAIAVSFFGVVTAFGTANDQPPPSAQQLVSEAVVLTPQSMTDEGADHYVYEARAHRGDTTASLLGRLHINPTDIANVLKDKRATAMFNQLRPGTTVDAQVDDSGSLSSLRFVGAKDRLLGLDRTENGFNVVDESSNLETRIVARAGVIGGSFFATADASGVPDSIASQLSEVFGTEIDFHRDFRRGDRFTVVFETLNHQGRVIRPGRLLAAEVIRLGRAHRAVWFESGDTHGYFRPDGRSLRHSFLRSPLEFTRITSGFEVRFMPGINQWQEHKGIDYAAPAGTPVRATGDGTVDFVGVQGGYGNVVIVKHKGETTTLYAHLSQFAGVLHKGSRVAQGEVIGYVGQTGWATGPHLHYEYQVRGTHVDPLSVALPSSTPIPANMSTRFRNESAALVARLDMLRNTTLASAD